MDELSASGYNYIPLRCFDRALMSSRDTYWFVAGAASGLAIGALSTYFLVTATATRGTTNTAALPASGDRWPTLADANSTGTGSTAAGAPGAAATPASGNAGSLDEVTRKLAQRLATRGGTDDEWRLLAQSYEYMGRTDDARAARMHMTEGGSNAQPAAPHGSRITGTIGIAPDLAAAVRPGMTLFVYATEPGTRGPPLAVRKLQIDHWPVSFVLDDADAMVPGRTLSTLTRVQVEARVSASGEALPRTGDLIGRADNVDPHTTEPVRISIDRKIG